MNHTIEPDEVLDYLIGCPEGTKLYLGADSERLRIKGEWFMDVTTVLVVHLAGSKGCKIFGEVVRQRDYEKDKSRPIMRMMAEVYSVAALFDKLKEVIAASEFDFQIHLDINPNLMHGSSCAVQQALGYIKGTVGVTPLLKPEAFSASYCADRYKEIKNLEYSKEFA